MAITINLVRDWESIQLDEFQRFIVSWGFESETLERYLNASQGTKEWDLLREVALMTWFNYLRRRIRARPRKIVPNPSLKCPSEVASGWFKLQQEIKRGDDLTPRLSRKIEEADCNDGMLNDWGIHHFHLGTAFDPKHPRLVQGTGLVLFAIVDPYEIYPIDFGPHGSWGDRGLLEKAISSFPGRFESFCLKGFTDVAGLDLGENVVEMRKNRMNPVFRIGNKIYIPPGMGVTTAGTSVVATMMLDHARRQLLGLEARLCEFFKAKNRSVEITLTRDSSKEGSFKIEVR